MEATYAFTVSDLVGPAEGTPEGVSGWGTSDPARVGDARAVAGVQAWRQPATSAGAEREFRLPGKSSVESREHSMAQGEPTAEFHAGFSEPGASARSWAEVVAVLTESEMFWLSTVRRDGRPHVTPLPAIWVDGALHSAPARKSRNRRTWRPIRVASSLRVPTGFTRDSMLSWREPPAGLPTRTNFDSWPGCGSQSWTGRSRSATESSAISRAGWGSCSVSSRPRFSPSERIHIARPASILRRNGRPEPGGMVVEPPGSPAPAGARYGKKQPATSSCRRRP